MAELGDLGVCSKCRSCDHRDVGEMRRPGILGALVLNGHPLCTARAGHSTSTWYGHEKPRVVRQNLVPR